MAILPWDDARVNRHVLEGPTVRRILALAQIERFARAAAYSLQSAHIAAVYGFPNTGPQAH